MVRTHLIRFFAVAALLGACSCRKPTDQPPSAKPEPRTQPAAQPAATQAAKPAVHAEGWTSLFDGKTLDGWTVPDFGGSGKVYVKDGAVHMEAGEMCTGFTYVEDDPNAPLVKLPREDYEIELEAMRREGVDFFCGLTFPVGKDHISLILDGWGGSVTGLSCLDGWDASENETTQDIDFADKRWYRVRARVTKTHIRCWVDDRRIISVARAGKKISIRPEVDLSVPLGLATWQTHGVVRGLRIRRLAEGEAEGS